MTHPPQPPLRDGVLLVTGSNGGLGAGVVADLLSNRFLKIACHYRSANDRVAEVLSANGVDPGLHCFQADLTVEDDVRRMKREIEEKLGPVSGILNLAGETSNAMFWKLDLADFRRIIDSNLTSAFLCCREFVPAMRENQWGRIIHISSVVAFRGVAGAMHYCTAKAGVVGMTRGMALELAPRAITVNCIALGYFDKGMIDDVPEAMQAAIQEAIPMKRFGTAADFGALVRYLLSEESAYVTGQVFHLNGGY